MIWDILQQLRTALDAVPGLRAYDDPGALVDPPGAVIGAPTFTFDGYAAGASGATVPVTIVAPADDRALQRLIDLLPAAAAAVDSVPDCVMRTATPGTLPAGAGELPAYLLEIEVSLT